MIQSRICLLIASLVAFSSSLHSQVPMNWTRDEINPGEDFTLTADGSEFTEGLKSLHMQLNNGAIPYLVSEVFYVSPGAEYKFSIDVLDNDTAGQVKIFADFYDAYGFDIFGEPPLYSKDSSQWQTIRWTGTVPEPAVVGYVLIKFYNQPSLYNFTKNAHIWLDRVSFRQPDSVNLVVNGGFENWSVGIEDPALKEQPLSIYPNPAFNYLQVKLPLNSSTLILSDPTGRALIGENVAGKERLSLDVRNLPQGLYILAVKTDSGNIYQQKALIK